MVVIKQRRRKPAWLRSLKESGLIYGLGALVIGIATWFTFQFIEPAPPRTLTIATGSVDGAYQFFAKRLQRQLAEKEVDLHLVETGGSVDNLARLASNEVDVAFMQSGVAQAQDYPQLESLGALYFEPVWIFTREGLKINRVGQLKGLRVGVGGAGSGSRLVASRLLMANGLSESDVRMSDDAGLVAVNALQSGALDVLISVASVNAPVITALLNTPRLGLATLPRAPAYARKEPWLTHLTLPEGVIDLANNIPPENVDLLAVNATLVATDSLHPALRDLLLQTASVAFSDSTVLSATREFPKAIGSEFPLASTAERFYEFGPPFLQRYLPFWVANLVDRLKLLALPLVALLLPLSRMLPPAYRWSVRKKIYRWYDEVQNLDQSAGDNDDHDNLLACLSELRRIEADVREVEVPLSYMHELYVLRQHLQLLIGEIGRQLNVPADRHSYDSIAQYGA